MPVEVSETFLSPTLVLWIVVSATAALLLFGSIHRRRTRLTDTLRSYVDRSQSGRHAIPPGVQHPAGDTTGVRAEGNAGDDQAGNAQP